MTGPRPGTLVFVTTPRPRPAAIAFVCPCVCHNFEPGPAASPRAPLPAPDRDGSWFGEIYRARVSQTGDPAGSALLGLRFRPVAV
jgi:hypothetical protein